MKTEFYFCPVCGNIVLRVVNSGVTPTCCNQPMQKLEANTVDASHEKHVPVITRIGKGTYRVTVGSEPHPVTEDHHLNFIYLETEHGGQMRYLSPGHPAEADFCDCYDPIVGVYTHCNLHGLWYADAKSCLKNARCTMHDAQSEGAGCTRKTGKLMALLAMIFPFAACSCHKVDNTPVPNLNLDKYLGKWYEIGRFDHWFEEGMDNCVAEYALDDKDRVRVVNSGWDDETWKSREGIAKLTKTSGILRVSFFRPFYSDYRVLMVNDAYTLALVGSKTSDYLWILAREPHVDYEALTPMVREARRRGYDTTKMIWVSQEYNKTKEATFSRLFNKTAQ